MRRVYLAAPFEMQAHVKTCASDLAQRGYEITAEWLEQVACFTKPGGITVPGEKTWAKCQEFASRDIRNVLEADTLILFCPGIPLMRNTRLSEFGGALFTGRQCIVIGPEDDDKKDSIDQIFTHFKVVPVVLEKFGIKPVIHFQHWSQFLESLEN